MDLVGEHPPAVAVDDLGDGLEFDPREHGAGGVVGVAQHKGVAPGAEGGIDAVDIVDPASVDLAARHLDHLATEGLRIGEERHVRGRRHDHGGTGWREVFDGYAQSGHDVRDGVHPVRVHHPVVSVGHPLAGGGGEVGGESGGEVAEHILPHGSMQRIAHGGSGAEIHLRHPGAHGPGGEAPLAARRPLEAGALDAVEWVRAHRSPLETGLQGGARRRTGQAESTCGATRAESGHT